MASNASVRVDGSISIDAASGPSTGYGPPPGITFDRFVRACVAVKTLTEAFHRYLSFFSPSLARKMILIELEVRTRTATDG